MGSILKPSEALLGKTPIPVQDTWDVLDSSKIQTFMNCPRGFFFSHILGWRKKEPNIHFGFGGAMHDALEILQQEGLTTDAAIKAYNAFEKEYYARMEMAPETLEELHPSKKPSTAFKAIAEYTKEYKDEDRPEDTLFTEVAGTCLIRDDRVLHVKMDTIKRFPSYHIWGDMLYSLEHKTTTRNTKPWREKWEYKFQVDAYNHALICMASDPSEVFGVVINGIVFNANKRQFVRIPIQKSLEMREAWLNEANHWWDYLEWNMEMLAEASENDRTLVAFPRNTESCGKFGCNHTELCSVHANPLRRCHQPPLGYTTDFWDPREREKKAKFKLEAVDEGRTKIVKNKPQQEEDGIT